MEEDDAGVTFEVGGDDLLVVEHSFSFYRIKTQTSEYYSCKKRITLLDDDLTPKNHDVKNYTAKALIMIYAHYMSMEAPSLLSQLLEDKLVSALFDAAEILEYRKQVGGYFATLDFKKEGIKEKISLQLRDKIDVKLKADATHIFWPWKQVELLVGLLRCASGLEKKVRDDMLASMKFKPEEVMEKQIEDTLTLGDRVFEHLLKNPVFSDEAEVNELMQGLELPSDAVKIMRDAEKMAYQKLIFGKR